MSEKLKKQKRLVAQQVISVANLTSRSVKASKKSTRLNHSSFSPIKKAS